MVIEVKDRPRDLEGSFDKKRVKGAGVGKWH